MGYHPSAVPWLWAAPILACDTTNAVSDPRSGPAGGGDQSLDEIVAAVTRRLVVEFAGLHSLDVIEGVAADEAGRHAKARITSYLPVLVERQARARLRAMDTRPEGS